MGAGHKCTTTNLTWACIDAIIRDAEKPSETLLDKRPKAPVVAQAYPRFRENNAAAGYSPRLPDGSRPALFNIR